MPLQKQIVQLPFGGLQTKIDPKIAPLGTYAVLDNWIMHQFPKLEKRDGLRQIGVLSTPTNITANYSYLYETGVITTSGLYAYSPVLDKFLSRGNTASPVITPSTVIANTYAQTNCDSAVTTTSSIQGTIWEDSRGGVRCSIQDITSDTFLQTDFSLSTTGVKPKVVAVSNIILFLWAEPGSTSLVVRQYNPTSNTFGSQTTITSSLNGTYVYDAIMCLGVVLIAYVTTTGSPNCVRAVYWNTISGAIGGSGLAADSSLSLTNATSGTTTLSLAVGPNSSYFVVTWKNASNQVYTKSFFNYFTAITSELQVANTTTNPGQGLATCVDSNNNTYIFYSTYKGCIYLL